MLLPVLAPLRFCCTWSLAWVVVSSSPSIALVVDVGVGVSSALDVCITTSIALAVVVAAARRPPVPTGTTIRAAAVHADQTICRR